VKKHLFAITFLIAAFTLIAHDAIPHRHPAIDKSELCVSHLLKGLYDSDTKDGNDQHDQPIPHHQHVLAPDDFISRTNTDSIQKAIKILFSNSICFSSFSDILKNDFPQKVVFSSKNELPDPYPFIISPNAMRGSPSNI
jgi:hypothetical protein